VSCRELDCFGNTAFRCSHSETQLTLLHRFSLRLQPYEPLRFPPRIEGRINYNPITTPLMYITDGWEQRKRCDIGFSIHNQGKTLFAQDRTYTARQRATGIGAEAYAQHASLSSRPDRQSVTTGQTERHSRGPITMARH
jgi:hypothetical protein